MGAVRDYVLGVSLINGRQSRSPFGQVMKNVAGYDVSRLMAGSWGTLGLLYGSEPQGAACGPAEATLRFECNQADALRKLHAWGGQPLPLNASCWVQDGGVGTLYVRLRGAVAAVQAACKSMGGTHLDNATTAPDWSACRDHTLPWFAQRAQQPTWPCGACRCPPPRRCWRCRQPPAAGGMAWCPALGSGPASAGDASARRCQAVGGSASVL